MSYITTIPSIPDQIEVSARDLAARINAGLLDGIDDDQKADLRALTLSMLGWSDDLRTQAEENESERLVARIGRLFGRSLAEVVQ